MVLHGDHILGMGGFLPLDQPHLQLLGEGKVPLCGIRFQILRNRGFSLADYRIVPDMDHLLLEVDALPLEAKDFSPPHSGMEGYQQKGSGPGILYLVQKEQTFLRSQRLFLLSGFPRGVSAYCLLGTGQLVRSPEQH